ncbi:MAG TPA: type II toxin-antitoxin system Phd/YefM family antitoxin [Bryobacteraceae bacterium]|nr:type II toxin-antitoxin system Phd/YefM family antitoxin [Bryobacteraceae bacterium]
MKRTDRAATNAISALTARSQFGRILDAVDKQRRSFVIEKRGRPKAVLLSIQDYIRLAAPEPEILTRLGEASARRGTGKLTMRHIDRVIRAARIVRRRAGA